MTAKRVFVFAIALAGALGWLILDLGIVNELSSHFRAPSAAGRREHQVLFFVRVPKTGSEMTVMLLQWLQGLNRFRHVRFENTENHRLDESEQLELRQDVLRALSVNGEAPVSFDRHVYFTNLENLYERTSAAVRIGYFSMVRDPIDRIVSQFYYVRATPPPGFKLPPQAKTRKPVKHHYQTIEECFDAAEPECTFVTGRHYSLQIPYFCGNDDYCTELNNLRALEQAKNNVEHHFAVVGVLELLDCTLKVTEKKIGTFFSGVRQMYFDELLEPKKNKNNSRPRQLGAYLQKALRNNLTMEYSFYDFVRQRLEAQCSQQEE